MLNDKKKMKQLVAAIERGEGEEKRTYWTRIGVAFENRELEPPVRFPSGSTGRDYDPTP